MGREEGILSCEGGVFCSSSFSDRVCFFGGGLVVPVLEVFIHGGLLGSGVFLHHGEEAGALLCGLAVHGFVEGCIPGVVFDF